MSESNEEKQKDEVKSNEEEEEEVDSGDDSECDVQDTLIQLEASAGDHANNDDSDSDSSSEDEDFGPRKQRKARGVPRYEREGEEFITAASVKRMWDECNQSKSNKFTCSATGMKFLKSAIEEHMANVLESANWIRASGKKDATVRGEHIKVAIATMDGLIPDIKISRSSEEREFNSIKI